MAYYGLYNSETDCYFTGTYQYQFARYASLIRIRKTRCWDRDGVEIDDTPYDEITKIKKYRSLEQAKKAAELGYENYSFVPQSLSKEELELITLAKEKSK